MRVEDWLVQIREGDKRIGGGKVPSWLNWYILPAHLIQVEVVEPDLVLLDMSELADPIVVLSWDVDIGPYSMLDVAVKERFGFCKVVGHFFRRSNFFGPFQLDYGLLRTINTLLCLDLYLLICD